MKNIDLNINHHRHLTIGKAINNSFKLVSIFFTLIILGCTETKHSQCAQVFYIAQSVIKNNQQLGFSDQQTPTVTTTKKSLSAASAMNQAADNMMALKIDQIKLIDYRNKLATIYNIYAQATYDAVKANEDKNLEALKTARKDAAKAGKIQRNLVKEINIYCTDN